MKNKMNEDMQYRPIKRNPKPPAFWLGELLAAIALTIFFVLAVTLFGGV